MKKQTRRKFSPAFKAKVALEALKLIQKYYPI
jgi:transposase-like protein